MHAPARFFAIAAIGYAIVIGCLTAGAGVAVHRLDVSRREQTASIEAHGRELLLAERLRSAAHEMTAALRGYLIAGDESLLVELNRARAAFARRLDELRDAPVAEPDAIDRVVRAAAAYDASRARSVGAAATRPARTAITDMFEADLLPLHRDLDRALDDLVARTSEVRRTSAVAASADAAGARRLATGIFVATLFLGASCAWLTTRWLAGLYGREQEALRRAEAAVGARDEALGVVAHDLRNPLNAIGMKAQLIARSPEPSERTRAHARAITTAVSRMGTLTGQLLDVAVAGAGSGPSIRSCRVGDLIDETVTLFESLAEPRSVALESTCDDPDARILADADQVLQILSNLVGNALRFTPTGGSVRVVAARADDRVVFTVRDTGPGIPAADAPFLFERFWTSDGGARRGVGLGLFIAKRLVEAQSGKIWVESRPGEGSAFHFTLPVDAGVASPSPRPPPAAGTTEMEDRRDG
jgi:signal transduction histidine kinase